MDQMLSEMEELEHECRSESDRTTSRTTESNNTSPRIIESEEETLLTSSTQPSLQLEFPPLTFETQASPLLRDRALELIRIMRTSDLAIVEQQLESFLTTLAAEPIPETERLPMTSDIPLIYAIIQSKAHKIFRKEIFCPIEGCARKLKTIHSLSSHLHAKHRFDHEQCVDIVHFFIGQMLDGQLTTKLFTLNERDEEELIHAPWTLERCYFPHCTSSHPNHTSLENHFKKIHKSESTIHHQ
jgi:hypothetical protein